MEWVSMKAGLIFLFIFTVDKDYDQVYNYHLKTTNENIDIAFSSDEPLPIGQGIWFKTIAEMECNSETTPVYHLSNNSGMEQIYPWGIPSVGRICNIKSITIGEKVFQYSNKRNLKYDQSK